MASADEYAAWIVQNADKKGTPDFETVAKAYKASKRKAVQDDVPINVDPTADMGIGSKVLAGIGQGMRSVWDGITFAPKAEVDDRKKTDAALLNTGAGTVGSVLGQVAATAPAAFIPGANTVLGAGAIGTGLGALTTPGDASDRATGAAMGGAGGMLGQAVPRVFGAIRAGSEPFTEKGRNAIIGRVMNSAAGDNAPQVSSRLRAATELVPGSKPTAAEVGESGGIAALQRAMSAAAPEEYAHRGMEQSAARVQALRGIAGTESDRGMAKAVRDFMSDGFYKAARQEGIDPAAAKALQPQIDNLMGRMPSGVMEKARELARIKGEAMGAEGSVSGLHYIKKAVDDLIDGAGQTGMGKQTKSALLDFKSDLLKTAEDLSPKYMQGNRNFSTFSKPLNQQDIGQHLVDKLSPALADHGALARETANSYATALRNAEATVKRSTGFQQPIEKVMSGSQMDTLNSVGADLGRKANAQDLGRGPGSNTFQNFAMDNLAKEGGMPSAVKTIAGLIPGLSPTATVLAKGAGYVGKKAYESSDELMRSAMAKALLSPQNSAALMDAASKPQALARALQALPESIKRTIPPADLLKLLQAAPGLAGTTALPAYLEK